MSVPTDGNSSKLEPLTDQKEVNLASNNQQVVVHCLDMNETLKDGSVNVDTGAKKMTTSEAIERIQPRNVVGDLTKRERLVVDLSNSDEEERENVQPKRPRGMAASIPVVNGWVIFKPNSSPVTFDEFIEFYDPIKLVQTECAWICAQSPSRDVGIADSDVPGLVVSWQTLHSSMKSAEMLQTLAKVHNVVVGKWMVFVSREKAKSAWAAIAADVVSGQLGTSAKISTASSESNTNTNSKQQHVICVYTKDFTDQQDVWRVRMRLKALGFSRKLHYKADAYTYCNVYASNPWNIPPSCYSE